MNPALQATKPAQVAPTPLRRSTSQILTTYTILFLLQGNLLWNAGRTSSHYLEEHTDDLIRDKDVLEIGAAAGVPSIVSAIHGARTVVMTDYYDPDLVSNMQYNADLALDMIPKRADSQKRLRVEGYKWGNPVEPLFAHLPVSPPGEPAGFDVLIMADVIYNYPEHANLVKTMQLTLKKTPEAVALVIFTPYEPWLLPQTEKFFPRAEEGGFAVTKIFQKMMDHVLFENDPGVSDPPWWLTSIAAESGAYADHRMRFFARRSLDMSFDGSQNIWTVVHPRPCEYIINPFGLYESNLHRGSRYEIIYLNLGEKGLHRLSVPLTLHTVQEPSSSCNLPYCMKAYLRASLSNYLTPRLKT